MGLVGSKSERLSEEENKIVRETWPVVMQNPEANALLILDTFFDKHPGYLPLFDKFKGIAADELRQKPAYKRHALAILNALDSVIVNLDDDSKVKDSLEALGRQHGKKSVTEKQFQELKAVFLGILSENFKLPQEGLVAWSKTFDIALNYITQGLSSTNS